jgi:hypothetical protein
MEAMAWAETMEGPTVREAVRRRFDWARNLDNSTKPFRACEMTIDALP